MKRKKRCIICKDQFPPYSGKQKTCRKKRCRQRHHRRLHQRWLNGNPGYFKGRYPNTKRWLQRNPSYLKQYRKHHPDYVAADNHRRRQCRQRQQQRNADIQERSLRREIERIRGLRGADIQESLRLRLDGLFDFLAAPPRADIQESLAGTAGLGVSFPP